MKIILTLALALPALASTAQTLTNDGAAISVQSGGILYVDGTLKNNAGGTLANDGTVELTGDLTNGATATSLSGAGLLRFSGSADQTLNSPAGTSLNRLETVNTGGAGANRVLVPNDLTVTNQLILTSGLVRTDPAATVLLPHGATLIGEATGRYVQGNLRAVRNAVSGSAPVAFPNSAVLTPTGQNLGTVTITRTAGLRTAGLSYGQNLGGTNKGIDRVWSVAATGAQPSTATPMNVALSWLPDDDNGFSLGTNAQMWRAATAAGPWVKMDAPGSAASRSFAADVTQFGTLTVSNISAPLPVELTRFTAEPQGADALLKWATASERNNDHFDVEASADGRTFRRIGQVAGHGTSTQAHDYQLLDPAIARYGTSLVYYRLRQVDADGTASYAPVRTVAVGPAALTLFPNPTPNGAATLVGAAPNVPVQVFDAVGRLVLVISANDTGQAELLLPAGAASGVYVVRVGGKALRLTVE